MERSSIAVGSNRIESAMYDLIDRHCDVNLLKKCLTPHHITLPKKQGNTPLMFLILFCDYVHHPRTVI